MTKEKETQPLLGQDKPQSKWEQLQAKYLTKEVVLLMVYTVLYVVSGVINSLFLRKVMTSFQNYPFFLNQLTNYGYIPIFGAVVLYEMFFTKLINKEMRAFPWYRMLIMGALDAVCGYFVVIGGIQTSGPMQQLLNQAIIPVTMIGAFFVLKERYSLIQIGGSGLIVAGVVLSLIPALTNKGENTGNVFFWNMFYLCQVIPFAASNVYKDIAFKSVDMDVWYLQFWDVFWQSMIGTMLFPINTVLPPPAKVEFSQIPANMKNGTLCLIGHDLITPLDSACGPLNPKHLACDDCHNAWLILGIYMAINVAYNVFILLVIKYGSATILSIAQTIRLPLTNICFSFHFIMGKDAQPFSGFSLYGLLVILSGLVAYRAGSLAKAPEAGEGEPHKIIPRIGPGATDYFVEAPAVSGPLITPKSHDQQRKQYLTRLGLHTRSPGSFNNANINA